MLSCYVRLTETVQKPLTDINPTTRWRCLSVSQSNRVTGYKNFHKLFSETAFKWVSLGFWSVSKIRQVLRPNTTAVSSLVCDRNGPEDSVEPCLWVHISRLFGLSGFHTADSQISLRWTSNTDPCCHNSRQQDTSVTLDRWRAYLLNWPSLRCLRSSSSVLVLVLIGIDSHPAQHRTTSSTCNTSHPVCLLYSAHLQQS